MLSIYTAVIIIWIPKIYYIPDTCWKLKITDKYLYHNFQGNSSAEVQLQWGIINVVSPHDGIGLISSDKGHGWIRPALVEQVVIPHAPQRVQQMWDSGQADAFWSYCLGGKWKTVRWPFTSLLCTVSFLCVCVVFLYLSFFLFLFPGSHVFCLFKSPFLKSFFCE